VSQKRRPMSNEEYFYLIIPVGSGSILML